MSHMEEKDFDRRQNWFLKNIRNLKLAAAGRKGGGETQKIIASAVMWVLVGSREMNGSGSVNFVRCLLIYTRSLALGGGRSSFWYRIRFHDTGVTWLGNGSGRKEPERTLRRVLNRQRALVINLNWGIPLAPVNAHITRVSSCSPELAWLTDVGRRRSLG
jgi:hypothetical protein